VVEDQAFDTDANHSNDALTDFAAFFLPFNTGAAHGNTTLVASEAATLAVGDSFLAFNAGMALSNTTVVAFDAESLDIVGSPLLFNPDAFGSNRPLVAFGNTSDDRNAWLSSIDHGTLMN
jgi:hypothetical protein